MLSRFGLVAVNTFPSAAFPDCIQPTWKHKCIDYICIPADWQGCCAQVACPLDLGNMHDDHRAVAAHLHLRERGKRVRRGRRRQHCRVVSNVAPVASWSVDVHSHAEALFRWAQRCRRATALRPTKPFLSEDSLSLLAAKRLARRQLDATDSESPGWLALLTAFRSLSRQLRQSIRQDKLTYVTSVASAVKDGLDASDGKATWDALRFFRPAGGRVKKPFRSLPMLRDPSGSTASSFREQQSIKAMYFGEMEAAVCEIPTGNADRTAPFAWSDAPTLCDLEAWILRMPGHKAPGPSGVCNDFWKEDPLASAKAWLPVVLKMHKRGTEPIRFGAGTLHTLFKRKGPLDDVASYRSIFLLEGLGKAFRRALRPALLKCAASHELPLFFGAAPGSQAGFLTHYLKTFACLARARGMSACVLMVDAKSAYYRVVRQRLLGAPICDAALCDLLHTMKVPADALQAVIRWAQGPSLTASLTAHQQRLLAAWFRHPCFLLKGLDVPFFSRCGTRPGDSIADVLFSIVLADCISSIRDRLHHEGMHLGPDGHTAAQPTWADDLALPVCGHADAICPMAAKLCQIVLVRWRSIMPLAKLSFWFLGAALALELVKLV